ncbi:MAG: cytochrome [Actinomycetia bacterium]|nr:cytochrome [Actinomycetes bacterium]
MDTATEVVISRYAEVRAVLADPRFTVALAGPGGQDPSMAWLRSQVSRFSEGPAHERRRLIATGRLHLIDPDRLRHRAHARTTTLIERADGRPLDAMADLARRVPAAVLGEALGVEAEALPPAVAVVAGAYFSDQPGDEAADGAVRRLTELFAEVLGTGDPEVVAACIGLLVQAYDSCAGLIGDTLPHVLCEPRPDWTVEALMAETLRHDPPLRVMRRVAQSGAELGGHRLPEGTVVLLDLVAAHRDPAVFTDPDRFDPGRGGPPHLTFGDGLRPCPGVAHALQLAAGVITAVGERCRLSTPDLADEALLTTARLEVIAR